MKKEVKFTVILFNSWSVAGFWSEVEFKNLLFYQNMEFWGLKCKTRAKIPWNGEQSGVKKHVLAYHWKNELLMPTWELIPYFPKSNW